MNRKGFFIALVGIDNAGKTTVAAALTETIKVKYRHTVLSVREPGGTKIGEAVRGIFKDPTLKPMMDPMTNLFLVNAARRQLILEKIIPALATETIIISDRTWICTVVYQGHAEGLDLDFVRGVSLKTLQGCRPDSVFWLDISLEEQKRRRALHPQPDVYDELDDAFHERVLWGYKTEHAMEGTIKINGEQPTENIVNDILEQLPSSWFPDL